MKQDFFEELKAAEWNKTFTMDGAKERYKMICGMFAENSSQELALIAGAAEAVLAEKYGMSWDEIEKLELDTYAEIEQNNNIAI